MFYYSSIIALLLVLLRIATCMIPPGAFAICGATRSTFYFSGCRPPFILSRWLNVTLYKLSSNSLKFCVVIEVNFLCLQMVAAWFAAEL